MNARQQAIEELKNQILDSALLNTERPKAEEALLQTLRRLSDPNLFALYLEIFGHAVGEKAAL